MNIIKKIIQYLSRTNDGAPHVDVNNNISMTERENAVYGEDKLSIRRMYEKWACEEYWNLYDEAIPLLFGIDPDKNHHDYDEKKNQIAELCIHARDCINKNLLPIINSESSEQEWQVRPIDLYRWATVSRISVPSELNDLMQFVMQTIKTPVTEEKDNEEKGVENINYLKHKEIVLGAAMSLLANNSESCMNSKNRVASHLIAKQIIINKNEWFGEEEPLLTELAIKDLLEQYLKLARPVI